MINLPPWALWSIAVAALLSPVLAFLMAIALAISIGALIDAGMLGLLALVAVGAIGLCFVAMGSTARDDPGPDLSPPLPE